MLEKISVIVCTKNVEDSILDCVNSIIQNFPFEIIVVDGVSTDKTIEKIKLLNNNKLIITSDEGKGLSYARRKGASLSKGDYILYIGPDNILEKNFILNFVNQLKLSKFDAAAVCTRVYDPKNYWDKGNDHRWKLLNQYEMKNLKVVGTPGMYKKECFQSSNFSKINLGPNDDTEFCDLLIKKGFRLGKLPLIVFEKNNISFTDVWKRFIWYGFGDYLYYRNNKIKWSFIRKVKSITHPLLQFLIFAWKTIKSGNLIYIPWLIIALYARYYEWIRCNFKKEY